MFTQKIIIILLSCLGFMSPTQSISGEQPHESSSSSEMSNAMVLSANTWKSTIPENCLSKHSDKRVYRMPSTILQKIIDKMKDGVWGNGDWGGCGEDGDKIEIFSNHFFNLNNNKLLLLLGISDYLCHSNTFLPVTVDYQGKWEYGRFIEGKPTLFVKGSDNALWLNSQWQIEATYPSLYRSTDGVHWQEITLPKNRNVDCCFEWLTQICLNKQQIRLKFYGDYTEKTKYWVTFIRDSLKPKPKWQPLNQVDKNTDKECSFVPVTKGSWIKQVENTTEAQFRLKHDQKMLTIIIPRWISVD